MHAPSPGAMIPHVDLELTDDQEFFRDTTRKFLESECPLTTVRQPIEPMGRMVIELLVAQLSGSPVAAEEYLFEPELVVRASTGPVPAR